MKIFLHKEISGSGGFAGEFYQVFGEIIPIFKNRHFTQDIYRLLIDSWEVD